MSRETSTPSSSDLVAVAVAHSHRECRELQVVLESVGIPSQIHRDEAEWHLLVAHRSSEHAVQELLEYQRENRTRSSLVAAISQRTGNYSGAFVGVVCYVVVIIGIAVATLPGALGMNFYEAGQSVAGIVKSGQWWRAVTALTLHVDGGHVASNALFGALFGLFAGRVLGGGIGWLAIVLAGTLGNYVNAWVQPPEHTSIGASTAVFGALGILVADALRPKQHPDERLFRRWSPLIGGLMLFSLTGVGGERTDVMAHVTGFLSGLLIGWICRRLPGSWLENNNLQIAAGLLTAAVILGSWIVAIAQAS